MRAGGGRMYHTSDDLWKDSNKPTKPENDTVTYLRQIEGLLDEFVRVEIEGKNTGTKITVTDGEEGQNTGEEKTILINNVFEEITKQEAALSTDKMSSGIIEKVLFHASDEQLVTFAAGLQGYFLFLASNRYSSHVLQTFLSLAGGVIDRNGLEVQPASTDETVTQNMAAVICSFCNEIDSHGDGKWVSLSRDICGTHVLRALLLVLGGKPVVKNSGGYNKKKKKGQKKGRDHFGTFNPILNVTDKNDQTSYNTPKAFSDMFELAMISIRSLPQANVYDLCFDSNSSSVMQLLLIMSPKMESRDDLAKFILDWDAFKRLDGSTSIEDMETRKSWLDEIVKAQSGSHALEAILRGVSASFFQQLFESCFLGRLSRYAQLPSANFVVQQLLACLRSKDQVRLAAKELIPVVNDILTNRTCLGVIWRLLEACLAHETKGKDVCRALIVAASQSRRDIVEALLAFSVDTISPREPHPHSIDSKSAPKHADGSYSKRKCIKIDIAGARVVQNLLNLHFSICRPILESIVALPSRSLSALAKDPVGSRSVVEPILDGPDEFNIFKQKLVDRLAGTFVGLACDRFGTYTTQKCFAVGTAKRKENIATELCAAIHVLEGSSFGRHVLQTCNLHLFENQRHKWLEQMKGSQNKKRVYEEVFGKMQKTHADQTGDNHDELSAAGTKKKRKRKKKKKKDGDVDGV